MDWLSINAAVERERNLIADYHREAHLRACTDPALSHLLIRQANLLMLVSERERMRSKWFWAVVRTAAGAGAVVGGGVALFVQYCLAA